MLIERYLGRKAVSVSFLGSELPMSQGTQQRHLEMREVCVSWLVREHRQELAKNLLSTNNPRISEVAQALGCGDRSVFCRAFQHWHGLAPSQMAAEWSQHSADTRE